MLLHLKTEKGFGYAPAMQASDKMHGVAKFDVATGKQFKGGKGGPPSYTYVRPPSAYNDRPPPSLPSSSSSSFFASCRRLGERALGGATTAARRRGVVLCFRRAPPHLSATPPTRTPHP